MKKKGNEALKKEYEAMGKKEKGLANIIFLVKKKPGHLLPSYQECLDSKLLEKEREVADAERGGCQVGRARATHASGKWATGCQRMPQYLGLLGVYGY